MAIIVGGPASNNIDSKLAEILNIPYVKLEHKIFPDGESYIGSRKSKKSWITMLL